MYAFDYHRPASVRQAAGLLGTIEDAKILAGGHTLLPTMKQRLASPAALVDLGAIPELKGIARQGRSIVIGAMTTHADVAASAVVREAIPDSPRWPAASAIPMCAIAAPSAARSPTTIRPPTIRPPALRWAP